MPESGEQHEISLHFEFFKPVICHQRHLVSFDFKVYVRVF